nr:hypothetical protein OG461_20165 [Streptomyces sp. NBC_00995]
MLFGVGGTDGIGGIDVMLEPLHRRELRADRERTAADQPVPYAEPGLFADGIQDEFARVDPVAFSEEEARESPWVHFFGDLRGGLYGAYSYRSGRV